MISNPRYGWCDVAIGNFRGHASYLTQVPLDLLKAFIRHLRTGGVESIYLDEEGSEFELVLQPQIKVVHTEQDDTITEYLIPISASTLAAELVCDIEKRIDDWAEFCSYFPCEKQSRKADLEQLVGELKELLTIK